MGNVQKVGEGCAQRRGEMEELEDGEVGAACQGLGDVAAREAGFSG
jgi:hypothetical protein